MTNILVIYLNMVKNNKNNKMSLSKANKKKSKQRKVTGYVRPSSMSRYPKANGDSMAVPFKFTNILTIATGASVSSKLLVFGPGNSTGDYIFLSDVSAVFAANSTIFARWMISGLSVEVEATGIGGNANTFIAASYSSSNSSVENPPGNLATASQSNHYAQSSLGTSGKFNVDPAEFFNDWRETVDADSSDAQCGVLKLYGSGSPVSSPQSAGVYTVTGVLHFCGFRFQP